MNSDIVIPGRVELKTGNGGLPYVELKGHGDEAHVYLHGGHVLHYQPADQAPVLWHSRRSWFEAGKPIRGGIPICWPWFGAHPNFPEQPGHGIARLHAWTAVSSVATAAACEVRLQLADSETFAARLELKVVLGDCLSVSLTTTNAGAAPMPLSQALHSYFAVKDVQQIRVTGLEGRNYIDTLPTERPVYRQDKAIVFAAETDRIYVDTTDTCVIHDPGLNRQIVITKEGSASTVVWNPWIAKASRMPDYGDDEYLEMVCVETANCGPDARSLAPGGCHTIATMIRVESM